MNSCIYHRRYGILKGTKLANDKERNGDIFHGGTKKSIHRQK